MTITFDQALHYVATIRIIGVGTNVDPHTCSDFATLGSSIALPNIVVFLNFGSFSVFGPAKLEMDT